MRNFLWMTCFCLVFAWHAPSKAEETNLEDAKQLVENLYVTFTRIYADSTDKAIQEQLVDYYYTYFDHKRVAGFILGSYRRRLSPEQQEAFGKILPKYMFALLSPQLEKYFLKNNDGVHAKFRVLEAKKLKRQDVLVSSEFEGKQRVLMNIRLRPDAQQLKILDVEVAGISMLLTQRDIISGLLKKHHKEFDTFLAKLTKLTKNTQQ